MIQRNVQVLVEIELLNLEKSAIIEMIIEQIIEQVFYVLLIVKMLTQIITVEIVKLKLH